MEEEEQKAVLEQVFGESSESESEGEDGDCGSDSDSACLLYWEWDPIPQVKGLWLCKRFLSPHQQSLLLSAIQAENWFTQPSCASTNTNTNTNQAMCFGHLPPWAIQLSHSIRHSVLATSQDHDFDDDNFPLPLHLLWREPLFDQLIANVYQPREGICAHVDLLRFDDGIAIVSLESSCVMHFTPAPQQQQQPDLLKSGSVPVPVLLTPGSLVLMSGEARYRWKHEINRKPGFQVWEGRELDQMRRTSITLRKLCSTP